MLGFLIFFQVTLFLSLIKALLCCRNEASYWYREQRVRMQQCRLRCGVKGSAPLHARLPGSLLQVVEVLLEPTDPFFGQSSFGKAFGPLSDFVLSASLLDIIKDLFVRMLFFLNYSD